MNDQANDKGTICIDFDGPIHRYSRGWQGGTLYDEPTPGAIDALIRLNEQGYKIVILTARDRDTHLKVHQYVIDAFFNAGWTVPFTVTNTKPPAKLYIDDRGVRFGLKPEDGLDWIEIVDQLETLIK